jgi:hypothetical protein
VFVARSGPTYSEEQARAAVAASLSFTEALRHLGKCPTGGAGHVLKKWTVRWGISTDHFDPYAASRRRLVSTRIPLEGILVVESTYNRGQLKERLFEAGLKDRRCELCGLGELWRGRRLSLILDHVRHFVSAEVRRQSLLLGVVRPATRPLEDARCAARSQKGGTTPI